MLRVRRRRSFTGRLLLAGLVVAVLLLALIGLLVRAATALAPRRVASGSLSRRRSATLGSVLAVAVVAAAFGTAVAASLTSASQAAAPEPAQTARFDDGAAEGGMLWSWIRGWPGRS